MCCLNVNLDLGSFFLRLWDPIGKRIGYIVNLKENLEILDKALGELKTVRDDLQERVEDDERKLRIRKHEVGRWLESVEAVEREVAEMKEAFQQMIIRCFGRNFRPNFCSRYKLGKRVMKKRTDVDDLIKKATKNSFDVVAVQPPPAAVEEKPGASALGMDPSLQKILRWLREDDNAGVIGIYGMGGVGKTTLLKKINNEFLATLGDFRAVIWVVVSKEANIGKIQKEIGKRLGLSFAENARDEDRAGEIRRALSQRKFLLLLDDIWERVDLEEKVGIPCPKSQNKSKVVFTTRREDVCKRMKANKEVKVEILGAQYAWDLFRQNAGEEAMSSHPEIQALAHSVAEECCGLPLALITVGRAMVCKNTPQEWEHAIAVLKTNKKPSQIEGMEDDVFIPLKFSYDALDDTLKLCFLYCSLFPEDHDIDKEQLIDYWIGEGIFNEWDDVKDARNEGHSLIERLKVACLLESGSHDKENEVKMHDVMRDLALWIASDKFLVQAGAGLRKEPELKRWTEAELKRWTEAERVSLMHNNIEEITVTPTCPNLLTLILCWNRSLRNVSDSVFQHMHLLRVLDLSWTGIRKLPLGIYGLVQLRYLNLSHTRLLMLPEEMRNLVNLTYLDLNWISMDDAPLCIPHGVISRLSMLKVLKLHRCNIVDGGFDIMELEELQYLNHLEIDISGDSDFQIFLQSLKLPKVTHSLRIQCLTAQTTSAGLSSIFGKVMQNLRDLSIIKCEDLEELMIGADKRTEDNCSNLIMKSLYLFGLTNLSIIRFGCSSLQNLRTLYIQHCDKLKNLDWVLQLHNIRWITVGWCNSLEEVIGSGDVEVGAEALRWLTELELFGLPALTSISNQARSFPSLKCLRVFACDELKKLNIHCNTDPRLKIAGEKKWWDGLEWEEEIIRRIAILIKDTTPKILVHTMMGSGTSLA